MPKNESKEELPKDDLTPIQEIRQGFSRIWQEVYEFMIQLTDLTKGMDREGTIVNIKNNKRMEGANAWLLMCSIMIASLGLDLNSPAVIIGAMLISPLMSPILGIGLAVGINDRKTLTVSLQHLLIAVGIALVTSTLYFALTPFGQATPEILARTKPTLLDVLVAFFGGIAGIISGSRKDKSNAIPGVAIATALMPPLCVTGFGIANLDIAITFNSFYLFFLNTTFVATATYIIVRLLNFPYKIHPNPEETRKAKMLIIGFCLLLILPSLYILSNVWREDRLNQDITLFLDEYFGESVDSWGLVKSDSIDQLNIKVYGSTAMRENMDRYNEGLKKYNIDNTKIQLIPTSEISLEKFEQLQLNLTDVRSGFTKQLDQALKAKSEKDQLIDKLRSQLDSIRSDTLPYFQLSQQIKAVFTDIERVEIATSQDQATSSKKSPVVLVKWKRGKSKASKNSEEQKLYNFIKLSTKVDTLQVVRY